MAEWDNNLQQKQRIHSVGKEFLPGEHTTVNKPTWLLKYYITPIFSVESSINPYNHKNFKSPNAKNNCYGHDLITINLNVVLRINTLEIYLCKPDTPI